MTEDRNTTTPSVEHTPPQDDSVARWRALYAQWLSIRAEWAAGPVPESRADELTEETGRIVLEMATTPVPRQWLEDKLEVLDHVVFHEHTSPWVDRRDELLLNSIKADVKALS